MVTAPPTSPTPPPVLPRRRALSRLSGWYWVALLAALVAAGAFLVASNSHAGVQVAVAVRDLGPGQPVGSGDLRFTDMDATPTVLAGLLRPAGVRALRDQVTTRPLARGQLVTRADVTPAAAPDRQRSMSVPVEPDHAVGGTLRPGDVVDVVDASTLPASYVVTGARVLEVVSPRQGGLSGTGRGSSVTLAVDEREALALAGAIHTGKLDVVRATGAPAAQLQTIPVVVPPTTGARR